MPTVVTARPYRPVPMDPPRKRWTRAEFAVLEDSGLCDQQRLELVQGELISKMGKKRPHVNALVAVQAWLVRTFGEQFVNPEAPIDVAPEDNPTNEPEPDLVVLAKPTREHRDSNPPPGDLRLVVEISDSTLGFDLTIKAELYARAGIVEYWVVDVAARRLIVHREPREGLYRSVTAYSEEETVSPLVSPECEFRVVDAFEA
ncbi:MAG TPA: Uma2 family endonuclease [Bryobacteraceae bacterium]|nr:Uma2 family endonuclease [Bryobacteraceae bacterium]